MSHKMFPVFMNDDRCGKMLGLEPVASGKKVKKNPIRERKPRQAEKHQLLNFVKQL
jgi:hypothetical protein